MASDLQTSVIAFRHPNLPPELIFLIFDYLGATRDWTTLRACTLLSHRYFRRARTHLFASITLRLRICPSPILIHDIVRRIHGLYEMFRRDPDAGAFVRRFEIIDSYPIYDSQWITQQAALPWLVNKLTSVRERVFGCEVGYLRWSQLSSELATSLAKLFRQPVLTSLTLSNIGDIPTSALDVSVRHLYLNNITTALYPSTAAPFANSRLCYMNLRTLSLHNTQSAWELMQAHSAHLKLIKWRCCADVGAYTFALIRCFFLFDGHADPLGRPPMFPCPIDLGGLPALRKLSVRLSFGRDLTGFCGLLESVTQPSQLAWLELLIHISPQTPGADLLAVYSAAIWSRLALALLRTEYRDLRRVTMDFTVHRKARVANGRRQNEMSEFRKKMGRSLQTLSNIASFNFRFKVLPLAK